MCRQRIESSNDTPGNSGVNEGYFAVAAIPAWGWTFFAPAASIEPGQRTGRYRSGSDRLVVDGAGRSNISAEDYAVALLDEIEKPRFRRSRMTVGY